MANETNLLLTDKTMNDSGEIVIAPEVIEVIIGIAASKVKGVYGMRGNLANNVSELFGRAAYGKGVYLKVQEDGAIGVDIYCYLDYNVTVPKVAMEIQEKVKEQVYHMTDLTLKEVNVHVMGVIPEKLTQPDLKDLLADGNEDE